MSAGIDIPPCHSARNRTIISGSQVLCASPEGISEDRPLSPAFFVFSHFHYSRGCTTLRAGLYSPRLAVSVCIRDNAQSSQPMRVQARTESVQVRPQLSGIIARRCDASHVEPDS